MKPKFVRAVLIGIVTFIITFGIGSGLVGGDILSPELGAIIVLGGGGIVTFIALRRVNND